MKAAKPMVGIGLKLWAAFTLVTVLTTLFVAFAIAEQLEAAKRSALEEAEHMANAIAVSGGADPVHHPNLLQRYIDDATKLYERDASVVNLDKLCIADSQPGDVGTFDTAAPNDEIGQTMRDGKIRAYAETITAAGYSHPGNKIVVPLRSDQANKQSPIVGAVTLEYTPLYDELVAHSLPTIYLLIALGMVCVLGAGAAGIGIALSIIRPIADLQRGVADLAEGNYRATVQVRSKDEIGALASAFNTMARDLSAGREKLLQYQLDLENRVASRTLALQRNNEELIQSNLQLVSAQQQLVQSEKMASLGQLAAGLVHEINTPISYVSSNVRSLETYLGGVFGLLARYHDAVPAIADPSLRADLESASRAVDVDFVKDDVTSLMVESKEGIARIVKIIDDLKDFSHPGGNDTWQYADLRTGFNSTLNIVNNEIKYKTTVVTEYADIPEVECLPSQINQVAMNLLMNAAHAIKDQGGKITLRTGREGAWVWFEVADNGSGIPKDIQSRIFDPFFTTKAIGKGTGLGLSLSYSIVQKHNGRIEVRSEPGEGTTFRVSLPIEHQAGAPDGATAEDGKSRDGSICEGEVVA